MSHNPLAQRPMRRAAIQQSIMFGMVFELTYSYYYSAV